MKKVLHRSFKPAKCKTVLQMASSRLKILKNKKDIQIKQLRRELAQLLESGQTQTARIRVEHVVREEKTVAAYELVGIYCELLVARLAVIESQKNCPTDLKEAVASVLYASQRLADVPELSEVVKHFSAKYGKDFASAAVQLRPDSGVSRLLVEKLSVKAPDGPTKVKILSEIAEEHNVKWEAKSLMEPDPKDANLLSGPSSFESAGRTYADSPRVPDKEPPNFQAPPAVNDQYGSSERTQVPVNSYRHNGRASNHGQSNTPPEINLGNTSDNYHPNARPSGDRTHGEEYRHPNPGDGNSSSITRQKWEMGFSDSTAAARAAAESAERASIAARAAAELSKKERMMRQNSTDSQHSYSSNSNRNEHPHRRNSSNRQSEDLSSPRRNVMQYEVMGSTERNISGGVKASECSDDELSEISQLQRGRHSLENLVTRQTDSFPKSGREKQPGEPDLNTGFSGEVHLAKQSSVASSRSRSRSRTFSDDHVVGSDYIESLNLDENIFAAAESAERESIAARAAAELSSKERMMRQNSTDSQNSFSSYNNRNEHPHRRSSSNGQSEDPSSSRRKVMEYEVMGSTEQQISGGAKASECSDDELSEFSQLRRGRLSLNKLETRQTDSFPKLGREKHPGEPDLNTGFSGEVHLTKQSSVASSRLHSRTFSDDHTVGSDYIESPNLEENIFATDDKHQPQSSPGETYDHDSDHAAAAAFDSHSSFFDKPQFDKEDAHNDELEYGFVSSLWSGETPAREEIDAWSLTGDRDKPLGKYSSSSQVFQVKPTSPVFDTVSTSPVAPLHEPEQSVKFDDYGRDSETEEDEPTIKAEISARKPEEEMPKLKSRTSPRFQEPDEVGHEFFPSDTDEPKYDSRTREESDSETQMGLRFGALTGGLRNKKALPPYRVGPARDATSSKPEKDYTQTDVDLSMPSRSVSSRSNRKELCSETSRDFEKKPISAPSDPSSSDDNSETELPGRTTIRQQGKRTQTETRASYLPSRIVDDDSEDEVPRSTSIRNQESSNNNKQRMGARDHKRPNAKAQASTSKLSSHFRNDEDENETREDATLRTNVNPGIGFSRRTKGQGKTTEKGSSLTTPVTAKADKESHVQQSPTKSQAKQRPPTSTSSSLPKVVTSIKTESRDGSAAETPPSKERASHVHPKLPDYDDLLATLGSRRPNRQ